MDFRSLVAPDGKAANSDSVLFDPNYTSVLRTREWEVPLAYLLSYSASIPNNSSSYGLIFIEH